ncbi:MAG: efflux transporter outer membrane subunit [Betaproteobacteria bacterium]|nr:efflux transporter outer membrane subunit [Betaproteobacteria bacterium]
MISFTQTARHTALFSAMLALSACTTLREKFMPEDPASLPGGPDYVRWVPRNFQAEPLPTKAATPKQSAPDIRPPVADTDQLPRPKQNWWTEFNNEELNELIETTLANNYDLRVAVARIEQAENQARIAEGARAPSVEFFSGIEARGPAEGVGSARSREEWSSRGIYQFGLRAQYEIDLWGRRGYEAKSALEQARASVFAREVVALTLIAETASAYFRYLSLSERIVIAQKSRQLAEDVALAIGRRVQRGDASKIDQQQQQIAIALIDNSLANLQLERERVLNRLAVYLGKPAGTIKISGSSLLNAPLPKVAPGLPSELLCRRPDIRRAEAQLAASSANVDAARANLLPSVTLTGQFGQGSFKLTELLSPQSILYSLAGNLVANVYDGERKENQLALARAGNRELLEQYANTVLAALRDVEDSLTGIRMTAAQQQALAEALNRNSKLLEMSHEIYNRGALDLISLLDLQRNVYLAQDAEAGSRFEQVRSTIDLFKALGGGVAQQQGDPCAPPTPTLASAQAPKPAAVKPAEAAPAASAGDHSAASQPLRPAGRISSSAAAQEAEAQAVKEAEAAARKPGEGAK